MFSTCVLKECTVPIDTSGLSNNEQMVLCLRFVDDNLEVHEELTGLYSLESTSADVVVSAMNGILLHFNQAINNFRGQCFDGDRNVSGA